MLARPVLTALVAELTVPLAERPWPFFDETDLLDFPGARTRETITDIDKFLAQPEKLGRALLRGKVAYLFQRYNTEKEITVCCSASGPAIRRCRRCRAWCRTGSISGIGATPQARAQQRNSLFLVLTKFDSEFEDKAGEDAASRPALDSSAAGKSARLLRQGL